MTFTFAAIQSYYWSTPIFWGVGTFQETFTVCHYLNGQRAMTGLCSQIPKQTKGHCETTILEIMSPIQSHGISIQLQ